MPGYTNKMRWLRLLAPYVAVGVFWLGFSHAWLAILAYHLQIIVWYRFGRWIRTREQGNHFASYVGLGCVLAGPLVYFILPQIVAVDLALWLEQYRMSGFSYFLMIPYFGLVHPMLEQVHWRSLRSETAWSHVWFAGYHVVVLHALLPILWLIACFAALVAMSWVWHKAGNTSTSRMYVTISHILADLGIVLAVWGLVYG